MKTIPIPFKEFEPLKTKRWILEATPNTIQQYFFKKCKISADKFDVGKFKVTILQSVEEGFTLDDLKSITKFTIKYLTPTGEIVSGYIIDVSFIGSSTKASYDIDSILKTKAKYEINNINDLVI